MYCIFMYLSSGNVRTEFIHIACINYMTFPFFISLCKTIPDLEITKVILFVSINFVCAWTSLINYQYLEFSLDLVTTASKIPLYCIEIFLTSLKTYAVNILIMVYCSDFGLVEKMLCKQIPFLFLLLLGIFWTISVPYIII